MQRRYAWWLAATLLVLMAILMIGTARQDSATVDETTFLGAGYTYWKGYDSRLVPEHPHLTQMLAAAPLLAMQVRISSNAQALLDGRLGYPWMRPWVGPIRSIQDFIPPGCKGQYVHIPPLSDALVAWQCPASYPMDNWYYWPIAESQMFGKVFVYDGTNDGDALMFAGRLMQIALTLLTGIVIFLWLNRFAGAAAGLLGLAMWALNPVSLGYGHLILTDVGVTLMIPVSIWALTVFLRQPSARSALLLGLATGGALAMKFNAVLLAPIFLALAVVYLWMQPAPERQLWLGAACKKLPLAAVAIWATLLVVYAPDWKPAPALAAAQATTLNVPSWFQSLRPLLVPRAYFRGLALALGFSAGGHEAFLNGEWRETGWWYYLLEAFTLKTPLPLLLLTGLGMVLLLRQRPRPSFEQVVPWVAAGAYLLLAMHSKINLGVRHLLPMYALLAVGVADQFSRAARKWRVMAWILCGWLGLVSLLSYPLYIQYFNEIAGGTDSGYMYLIDSNYDWGQDANRLKHFLDEHGIHHIYLDYFGTQFSIEYLKISNTRVNAEQARQITRGTLVVSASQLMRPEWAWLREQHQPMTRIAHTLFVYQLGGR